MQIKVRYLIGFVVLGIILMTFLVFSSEVRKEVREAVQKSYEKGEIDAAKYKAALSDGKLTNWEVLHLK